MVPYPVAGKTEAYLGLTAFTIFYRKLAHPKNSQRHGCYYALYSPPFGGTTVYPSQRALICACEYIRQALCPKETLSILPDPLGKEPITIGLWIGGSHIPNKNVGTGERSK